MSGGTSIYDMITGVGKSFSDAYASGQKQKLAADLGQKIKAGDYTGAADIALQGGDVQTGLALVKLGESRGASKQLGDLLGGLYGGGGTDAPDSSGGGTMRFGDLGTGRREGGSSVPSFADSSAPSSGYVANLFKRESNNNPLAQASTSSAKGLGQFTDGTWADTMRKHPELGLTADGRTDPDQMLRATQAFTADNEAILGKAGLPVNDATRYSLHFLGAGGGPKFVAGALNTPDAPAIGFVRPEQVRANRNIFFERDGRPKSAGAVLASFGASFGGGGGGQAPAAPRVAFASNEAQTQALERRMGMMPTDATAEADMPAADAQQTDFVIPPAQSGGALTRIGGFGGQAGAPRLGVPSQSNTTGPGSTGAGGEGSSQDGAGVTGQVGGPAIPTLPPRMAETVSLTSAGVPFRTALSMNRMAPGSPQRLDALIRASFSPGLSEQQQGLVKTLLTNELEGSKLPDAVKQYMFAKSAAGGGFDGSFVDFQNKKGDEATKIQAQLGAREKWLVDHGLDPKDPAHQAWIMGGRTSTGHVLKPGDVLAGPSGQTLARNEGSGAGGMDDRTADFLAERVLAGDTKALIGLGRGAQGAENLGKIQGLVAQKAAARGLDGTDILYNAAKAAGLGAQERSLGTSAGRMAAASVEAEGAIKLGLEASAAVPRGSFVPLNRAIQLVQSNTGDPALKQFVTANNTIVNTFARAISPSGTPTVSDKEHAREMLSTADSPEAYAAVLQQMQKEIEMAHRAPQQARTILEQERQNAKGGGAGAKDEAVGAGAGSPMPKFNPSTSSRISMRDAQDLKAAEDTAENRRVFDQRYGEGAAQFVLKKPAPAGPAAEQAPKAGERPQAVKGGKPPEGYTWDSYLARGRETLKTRPDLRPQIEDMLAKAGIPPERLGQ